MSRAFHGGSMTLKRPRPTTESEVVALLQEFIRQNFPDPNVADEFVNESDMYIVKFAKDGEQTSPATLGHQPAGSLVAYGALTYRATEHSVQTIWEHKFEVRESEDGDGVYVRVSDWYGTTVESWQKMVERQALYV